MRLIVVLFILITACASPTQLGLLTSTKCEDYSYGKIEASRILSDEEKSSLTKKGIYVQQSVFDNVYLGVWKNNIKLKLLEKLPIKKLTQISGEEKLSGGYSKEQLEELFNTSGSSNVIFNTFGELQEGELSEFGKLIKQNQGFFRMEINNARIPDLLEFPCLKSISILREMPIPDIKDSVQSEKIIKDIKDN